MTICLAFAPLSEIGEWCALEMPRLTNARRKAYNKGYYKKNRTRILTGKKNSANVESRKDERVRYRAKSKRILRAKKERYLNN